MPRPTGSSPSESDTYRRLLLVWVQASLLACLIFVSVVATQSSERDSVPEVLALAGVVAAMLLAALFVPWYRISRSWMIATTVVDILVIALLRAELFIQQPRLSILALIPVLWLSYSFRVPALLIGIAGNWFVALFPFFVNTSWPTSPDAWSNAILPPAVVSIVAVAVYIAARAGRRQRKALRTAYEDLRISVAKGVVGAEALRVSVAEGIDGAEALRVSVAEGVDSAEALRVSVAEGVDSAEALRVSVAEGVVGAEALRVSVAEGVVGAEALRVSVAEGVVGAEALRVSEAQGAASDEALRVSEAQGVDSAEALRVSVAEGVVGAEALRVSEAHGIDSAEALRVSIAQGLDAASAALAVVDTVDAGITFYDPFGIILLTNDTARELALTAGGSPLSHVPQSPLVFEDDRVTAIPEIDQAFGRAARGELVTRRTYWVGLGDQQRAMMATSQFVRRESGELLGTVVATHDITQLAEAIRTRDEFLTTVSHELRTPLTSVIGYLELIEDTLDIAVSGIAHEFGIVQRNAQRLLGLINDLLTTAEGQASLERRLFNISELATNSLNAIRPAAVREGVHIVEPDLEPVLAEVDANRIGDVFDKLLSNAVKFNRPGGEVSLSVGTDGDDVVVRVTDTGTGISAQDQDHIFERFFRSATARTAAIAGTGLGLSTAKIIVEAHHGSIRAESALGVGTTIEVRLPLRVANVAAAPGD